MNSAKVPYYIFLKIDEQEKVSYYMFPRILEINAITFSFNNLQNIFFLQTNP